MKKKILIPLIAGAVLLIAGIICFVQVCDIQNRIYDTWQISFTEGMIEETLLNGDESAIRAGFNEKIRALVSGRDSAGTAQAPRRRKERRFPR